MLVVTAVAACWCWEYDCHISYSIVVYHYAERSEVSDVVLVIGWYTYHVTKFMDGAALRAVSSAQRS